MGSSVLTPTPVLRDMDMSSVPAATHGIIVFEGGLEVRAHSVTYLEHPGESPHVVFFLPCDRGMHQNYRIISVRLLADSGACLMTAEFADGVVVSPLTAIVVPAMLEESA